MAEPAPIGVIANPTSGRDIRRLIASASHSTLQEKVSIVRRTVIGAVEAGARRILFLPEPHRIAERATGTLSLDAKLEVLDFLPRYRESDTLRAADSMRAAGCAAVVVLGGDGTNRAVALAWPEAPVIPLSTGTNNVFPYLAEPTIAGAVAGLLAARRLDLGEVARRAKCVEVDVEGEMGDVALVDAVALEGKLVGSLMLFEPRTLLRALVARAEPGAIGVSAVAGLVAPCPADADAGVDLRFCPPEADPPLRVRAPIAPGHYADVGLQAWRVVRPGESVELRGPCLLAFDGERKRALAPGQGASFTLRRNGPHVVDLSEAMRLAAERGLYRTLHI